MLLPIVGAVVAVMGGVAGAGAQDVDEVAAGNGGSATLDSGIEVSVGDVDADGNIGPSVSTGDIYGGWVDIHNGDISVPVDLEIDTATGPLLADVGGGDDNGAGSVDGVTEPPEIDVNVDNTVDIDNRDEIEIDNRDDTDINNTNDINNTDTNTNDNTDTNTNDNENTNVTFPFFPFFPPV